MNISYQYEVLSVDRDANCMSVLFKSNGFQDVTVGVRIPFEGEDVDAVIRLSAPLAIWQPVVRPLQTIEVGYSGQVQPEEADADAAANAEMWAQVEFERRVAKALLKFGVLQTDPTSIPITGL